MGAAAASGVVAGIDIGYSAKRASSAVCKLWWDEHHVAWKIGRYRATALDRAQVLNETLAGAGLGAVAFDGPLRSGLDVINEYRTAERNLTRLLQPRIGKPGQSNSPVGRRLNLEANNCATFVLETVEVGLAKHRYRIHDRFILEAFPTSFLGLMLAQPSNVKPVRSNRSDEYYKALTDDGTLAKLLRFLLPGRKIDGEFGCVTNHDDRAALVCALTALGAVAGRFCVVGDSRNGWIFLPPRQFIQPWAHELLEANGARDGSYHQFSS